MIEQTRGQVVVVADHSKMGTVADFVIAPLEQADALVVDAGIGTEYHHQLVEAGLAVTVAGAMAEVGARG